MSRSIGVRHAQVDGRAFITFGPSSQTRRHEKGAQICAPLRTGPADYRVLMTRVAVASALFGRPAIAISICFNPPL